MLPEAAGRGQHFQARGHSFSLYRPTPSWTITCLSFFLAVNWLTNEWVYLNANLSLTWLTHRLQTIGKKSNERTSEYLLHKETCIKEQIFFELLYVCCI